MEHEVSHESAMPGELVELNSVGAVKMTDGFAAGQLVQTHAVWQVKHIAFRSGLARFSSGHRHYIQDPGVRSPRLHDEVGILFGIWGSPPWICTGPCCFI